DQILGAGRALELHFLTGEHRDRARGSEVRLRDARAGDDDVLRGLHGRALRVRRGGGGLALLRSRGFRSRRGRAVVRRVGSLGRRLPVNRVGVWPNCRGSGRTSPGCGQTAVDKAAGEAHFRQTMATLPLEPAHAEGLQGHYSLASLREQRIRAVLWLTLIFWISQYAMLTLSTVLSGAGRLGLLIPIRVGQMALGLGFCF